MVLQYLLIFLILTEAKTTKKKKTTTPKAELTKDFNAALDPMVRYYSVPFGLIQRDGFDPGAKGPLDFFDFPKVAPSGVDKTVASFTPNDGTRKKPDKQTDNGSKANQQFKRDPYAVPFYTGNFTDVDEFAGKDEGEGRTRNNENIQRKYEAADRSPVIYFDFTKNHVISLARLSGQKHSFDHGLPNITPKTVVEETPDYRQSFIPRRSNQPEPRVSERREVRDFNWTTCSEFGQNAQLFPKDITHINWVPFYIWSSDFKQEVSEVHRFVFPTIKLVKNYKRMYSPVMARRLDWEAPKLLLRTVTMEMLLIAADRRGRFDGIRYTDIPEGIKDLKGALPLPILSLRIKSVGSYLAMMFCDEEYATIMAPAGTEPTTFEASRNAAAFLKFNGTGYPVRRDLELERWMNQEKAETAFREEWLKRENRKQPEPGYYPYGDE